MRYFTDFKEFVYSFTNDVVDLVKTEYTEYFYPTNKYLHAIDHIDFHKMETSTIVNLLNEIKYTNKYTNPYYEDITDVKHSEKLLKLKYVLLLCLESKKDTSDIMMKHIMKYKGEKLVKYKPTNNKDDKPAKNKDDKLLELERRFLELVKEIEEDENQDDDNGKTGELIGQKKKIAVAI